MSEPIYTFKKGEGWIPTTTKLFVTTRSGKKYYFEARSPNLGERYCWSSLNDTFATDGKPDVSKWTTWAQQQQFNLEDFDRLDDLEDLTEYRRRCIVTLVPFE